MAGHSRLREDWARRAEWEAEGSSAAAIGMREGYAKRPPCFCRVCVCVCVCVWECRALWAAVGVKVEALPHTCKFQCGSSSWHGAPVSLLSAVQHWPVLYRTALHSPHAVVVLACIAARSFADKAQWVDMYSMYVGVSIGIHVRISTRIRTLQPRSGSLTCIPAFRTWIVRYHLCATRPLPQDSARNICTSTLIAPQLFIAGQGGILGSQSARRHMRRDS